MTTAPAKPRYTPEDLLTMEDAIYELLDGELVERAVSRRSSETAGQCLYEFNGYLRQNPIGEAYAPDMTIAIFPDPNRARRADVSFVRNERLPREDFGVLRIAPDLVVEVMSPSNSGSAMRAKVDEWLDAGVREVWVLYPGAREAYIYRSDAKPRVLIADDDIETPDILPGFRTAVRNLFPPRTPPAASGADAQSVRVA